MCSESATYTNTELGLPCLNLQYVNRHYQRGSTQAQVENGTPASRDLGGFFRVLIFSWRAFLSILIFSLFATGSATGLKH